MKKRLFSLITALALCLSLLPATAMAEETQSYSIDSNGTLIISGTTDGSDLPTEGFTSIEIASTGVVTGGNYTAFTENHGTISGGSFNEVTNRTDGGLITDGTFEKVSNYGNMTGGTVKILSTMNTTPNNRTVQGVTVTESLYNNNCICNDMTLLIDLESVTNILGYTTVRMSVNGEELLCPVGQNADSWLRSNVENYTWYKVKDGVKTILTDDDVFPCGKTEYVCDIVKMIVNGTELSCPVGEPAVSWLKSKVENSKWYKIEGEDYTELTDDYVFPGTKTVYSTIPGKSFGVIGFKSHIDGSFITFVGDTIWATNPSVVFYIGGQPVEGKNEGWRVTYTVQEKDIGKAVESVLTDGYATLRYHSGSVVGPLSVTVPAFAAVGETISPQFNWQMIPANMQYQWQKDGTDIEGATSYTYTVTDSDLDHKLTLVVNYNNTTYTTDEITIANFIADCSLDIPAPEKGETPSESAGIASGENYTASVVTWSGNPTNFLGGTVYTAAVTLTPNNGYFFSEATEVTVPGAAVDKAMNEDGTLTVWATFPRTEADEESESDSDESGSTTYTPTVNQPDEGGTVSVSSKNPESGDKVTITPKPEKGYEIDKVIITDKDGNPIKVGDNGNGTYSFTQPDGQVNISVTFVKTKQPDPSTEEDKVNPFTDISPDAYYYDAVLWAAENDIAAGTGDGTTFSPDETCSRGQAITFLWRAAGCPAPKSSTNPFTDVNPDMYCYDAVLWAVENGITSGTSDTTFGPDDYCTRAQIMTFIYNSEQAKGEGMEGEWIFQNPFTDVDLESYYGEAVMWAVANGVTSGTGSDTFSPNADCTRAQIITFLYNCLGK